MGILNKRIKEVEKTEKKKTGKNSVCEATFCPTGIDLIDFQGGTTSRGGYNIGLPMGKINLLIGHSQSGKTTLAIQAAANCAINMNGDVVIFDFERSSTDPRTRIKKICGITDDQFDDTFTIFKQPNMTADFVKSFIIKEIVASKKEMSKDEMIPWTNLDGEEILIYPPTILIIDSISAIRTKEMLENPEMDTNMAGASIAKSNSNLITSIEPFLEAYNISIIGIGHITTKITINPYEPRKIQLPGLSDSEHIPGGNKFVYLASYVIKLSAGAEFKGDKDFKFQGRIVNAKLLKTRSGFNNVTLPLVYHSNLGFHNVLTNVMWAKSQSLLKGGGSKGFFLENMPDIKFTQSQFIKTYRENSEFQKEFDEMMESNYTQILDKKESESEYSETLSPKKSSSDFDEEEFSD